jgi:hypothetical protein
LLAADTSGLANEGDDEDGDEAENAEVDGKALDV